MRNWRLAPGSIPLALFLGLARPAAAAAPPASYVEGFEREEHEWADAEDSDGFGVLKRVPSQYKNKGGYADGIRSLEGLYHARLQPGEKVQGGGNFGPFTRWGGFSRTFPPGGFATRIDVYLDVAWARAHPDKRFDWTVGINGENNVLVRDFAFNAGTDATGFVVSASNKLFRAEVDPADPAHAPIHLTESGWYTFQHFFRNSEGTLAVDLKLIRRSDGSPVGAWTLLDPADQIPTVVGGNRYGWFANMEIPDLAIDATERVSTFVGQADCEEKVLTRCESEPGSVAADCARQAGAYCRSVFARKWRKKPPLPVGAEK